MGYRISKSKNHLKRPWTDEEIDILKEKYPSTGAVGLIDILKRSHQAIAEKAYSLRIPFTNENNRRIHNYKGYEDVSGKYVSSLRRAALKRNLIFEINSEVIYKQWQAQNGLCFYSGRSICFGDTTASVDRKVSSLGYTKDNIYIVHKQVNKMKMDRSHDEFLDLIKILYYWNNK